MPAQETSSYLVFWVPVRTEQSGVSAARRLSKFMSKMHLISSNETRIGDCLIGASKQVAGFSIPRLREDDDALHAIEMTAATPPYPLDFASAIFDEPPDFIEDEGNTFEDFMRSRFDENAEAVLDLYYELAMRTGMFLPDMHSQNVEFTDPSRDKQ